MNKQLALAIQLKDEATLADFNWCNNPLLHQQLLQMLDQKHERFLYIWGAQGLGKSHVLQAFCQAAQAHESAIYLPLKLLKEWGPESLEGLEDQTIVCIDDIEIIAHDAAWEEALFHLYNRIKDKAEGLLLVSGNLPPATLPLKLPDLRSRLSWGLVIQLNELSDEGKINTLQSYALKRGFDLPQTVAQFLLNRCARNMHDLQELLNRLDEASLSAQRKITIPFVKAILQI